MITQIGRYEIKAEIGHGAFGRVYKAYDPNVGRDVAIKVLSSEGDPALLERFRREIVMTGKLIHNNIVTVYDYGDQDGKPYLVMQLLEGENLLQAIENHRPLSILRKVQIMSQVAEALHYAHECDVVHRDVKPANIMLLPNGDAKIMDFGIARMTVQETQRTQKGDLLGSIPYMAPEQFSGTAAGALTDIFSYGVTFYELLTGHGPFHGDDFGAIVYQITSVEPVRIRAIVPDCPAALENIVHRALSKDRDLRYQSLSDLNFDLQQVLFKLRQEEASRILSAVPSLIDAGQWNRESGQWSKARAEIRRALELDPANAEGQRLAKEVEDRIQKELRLKKVEAWCNEAEQLISQQRFREAIRLLAQALDLEPAPRIQSRLEEVKAWEEARRAAVRLMAEARNLSRDNPDSALDKVREALVLIPGNPEALTLENELLSQILWRDRAVEFDGLLRSAEQILDRQRLADTLQDMRSRFPEFVAGSARMAALRNRLDDLIKVERVEAVRQNIINLIQAAQFGDARKALTAGLQEFRDEAVLKPLSQEISGAETRHGRNLKIAEVSQKIDRALKAGDLKESIRILRLPETEALRDPGLTQWREQLELDLARQEYEEGRQKAIEEGQKLLDVRQYETAVSVLKTHCSRYPDEPALRVLLDQAQQGVDREVERRVVNETIARTTELQDLRRLEDALELAKKAAGRYLKNVTLKLLVANLENELESHKRREDVNALRKQIEELIQQKNFLVATRDLDSARRKFGDEPQFDILVKTLERAKNQAILEDLCSQVDLYLAEDKLDDASRLLDSVRSQFGQETRYRDSYRELEKRQRYLEALTDARRYFDSEEYDNAERVLKSVADAPDSRAANLLKQVVAKGKSAELQRIMDEATEFNRKEMFEKSIPILRAGCEKYPNDVPLQLLLRSTETAQRDRQRDRALQDGIGRVESLRRDQQWQPAFDLLSRLLSEHGNRRELVELEERIRREWDFANRVINIRTAVSQAQQHFSAGRPDLAAEVLRSAIQSVGPDGELTDLLQRAEETLRQDKEKEAISSALKRAADCERKLDVTGSLRIIDEALIQYRNSPELSAARKRLDKAHDIMEPLNHGDLKGAQDEWDKWTVIFGPESFPEIRKELLVHKVAEGRRLLNSGRLKEAEEFVSTHLLNDRDVPEVEALLKDIRDEKTRRADHQDKEKLRAEGRRRLFAGIRQALDTTQWPQALELIVQARREYPNDPELVSLEARALDQRRAFLETSADEIRARLRDKRIEDAQSLFEQNLARFPAESIVQAIKEEIAEARRALGADQKKRAFIAQTLKQAEQGGQTDFAGAADILKKGLREYPADPELSAALSRVERKREEAAKTSAIKKLLDRDNWEDALRHLEELRGTVLEMPAEVAALGKRALEQRDREIQRWVGEATPLLALGKAEDAEKILTRKLARVAREPAVVALAKAINQEKARQNLIREIRDHITARRFEVAGNKINGLADLDPRDPELDRLRLALQSARLPDRQEGSQLIQPSKLRGSLIAIASVVLAGVAGTSWWIYGHRQVEVPGDVSPQSLSFEYQPGTEVEPQKVKITGPSEVAPPASPRWVSVVPGRSGRGETEFTVRVVPDGLSQGLHGADLTFPEVRKTVHLTLNVHAPQDTVSLDPPSLTFALDSRGGTQPQKIVATGGKIADPKSTVSWIRFTRRDVGPGKAEFMVEVSPQGLPAGSSGDLIFSPDNKLHVELAAPQTVDGKIEVQPLSLTFPDQRGNMQEQRITVTGSTKINDPSNRTGWVKIRRVELEGRTEFWVHPSLDGLSPGAQVPAELAFSDKRVRIYLTVPALDFVIEPKSLSFTGSGQSHKVTITGPSKIPDLRSADAWVKVEPAGSGPGKADFNVSIPDGVAPGTYNTNLTFLPGKGVPVSLTITPKNVPQPEIQPVTLNFEYTRSGPAPAAKNFTVTGPADIPEPAKFPAWTRVARKTPGAGVFQVEVLKEKLEMARDSYTDDVIFNFPQPKKVQINLKITEVAETLMAPIGTIRWRGELNPGDELVTKGRVVVKGGGDLRGDGVIASIIIDRDKIIPSGMEVLEDPNPNNNFKLRLRNNTGHKVTNLVLPWHQK